MDRNVKARLNAFIAASGPLSREEAVYTAEVGEAGKDGYIPRIDYGKFVFKRLCSIELDQLRVAAVNDKGVFDPKLYAGNNARQVATTLLDENGELAVTKAEVDLWPGGMADAFAAASTRVNVMTVELAEAITKNSAPTANDA